MIRILPILCLACILSIQSAIFYEHVNKPIDGHMIFVSDTDSRGYLIGSDSNDGLTRRHPLRTIEHALSIATPGMTIRVNTSNLLEYEGGRWLNTLSPAKTTGVRLVMLEGHYHAHL
jgi:hypothetical protein